MSAADTIASRSHIAGVILAGGLSRRMFALDVRAGAPRDAAHQSPRDKGLLDIGDKPMLVHVIERIRPQVDALAINANG